MKKLLLLVVIATLTACSDTTKKISTEQIYDGNTTLPARCYISYYKNSDNPDVFTKFITEVVPECTAYLDTLIKPIQMRTQEEYFKSAILPGCLSKDNTDVKVTVACMRLYTSYSENYTQLSEVVKVSKQKNLK